MLMPTKVQTTKTAAFAVSMPEIRPMQLAQDPGPRLVSVGVSKAQIAYRFELTLVPLQLISEVSRT